MDLTGGDVDLGLQQKIIRFAVSADCALSEARESLAVVEGIGKRPDKWWVPTVVDVLKNRKDVIVRHWTKRNEAQVAPRGVYRGCVPWGVGASP